MCLLGAVLPVWETTVFWVVPPCRLLHASHCYKCAMWPPQAERDPTQMSFLTGQMAILNKIGFLLILNKLHWILWVLLARISTSPGRLWLSHCWLHSCHLFGSHGHLSLQSWTRDFLKSFPIFKYYDFMIYRLPENALDLSVNRRFSCIRFKLSS